MSDHNLTKREQTLNAKNRPDTLPVIAANIPERLREGRWCCWGWRWVRGRWAKIPFRPMTFDKARTNAPATFGTYASAVAWYERHRGVRNLDGIGVLLDGDLCGIDLDDDCPDRHEWVGTFGSYAERSPTGGRGYKVFCRGACPGKDRQGGGCEIYDASSARWFCVTGHVVEGSPATVEATQPAIDAFYDAKIRRPEAERRVSTTDTLGVAPAPAAPVRHGDDDILGVMLDEPQYRALWDGDWTAYESQSQADAALVSGLAYYAGGDAASVDALFRRSGLYREKWERRSYREKTLAKYCARKDYYDWDAHRSRRAADTAIVPPWPEAGGDEDDDGLRGTYDVLEMIRRSLASKTEHMFDGLLETGVITLFCGLPYSGKSIVTLQLIRALSLGTEFCGRACRLPNTPVLYVNADRLRDRQFHRRLSAVYGDDAALIGNPPRIHFTAADDLPATVTDGYLARLIRALKRKHKSDTVLVVIDTMRPAFLSEQQPGAENDPATMTRLLTPIRKLAGETNCSVLLLHHNNRARNDYSGSAAIAGVTDAVWTITKTDHTARVEVESRDVGRSTLDVVLGPPGATPPQEAGPDPLVDFILKFPVLSPEAVTRQEASGWFPDLSGTSLRRKLEDAQRPGVHPRLEMIGTGRKDDPYRYFRV